MYRHQLDGYHVVPGVPPSYFSVILCRVCLFALVYELLDWMRHQLVDVFGFNVFLRDSSILPVVYYCCDILLLSGNLLLN